MKSYAVYQLWDNKGIFWVGMTSNLETRMKNHQNDKRSPTFERVNKGLKNGGFSIVIIKTYRQKIDALAHESFLIQTYRHRLLNQATYGTKGGTKWSQSSKDKSQSNYMRPVTDSLGNTFDSAGEAARHHKIHPGTLSDHLNGKTVKGYVYSNLGARRGFSGSLYRQQITFRRDV